MFVVAACNTVYEYSEGTYIPVLLSDGGRVVHEKSTGKDVSVSIVLFGYILIPPYLFKTYPPPRKGKCLILIGCIP